ncbi:GGDEF domain-containing protein [Halomonas sp. NO4]|uniref:GGDEF domain-containing protein n=1 Tax=Halomonas sp. NO4 TaxID=2484813 RepID=UPI0013D09BBE|nr:GGDEF domain-containing protein [Halomonas sp. NO4]
MREGFGLTARLAVLTALLTLVILSTIGVALLSFGEYRQALSRLSSESTRALMTASRLKQQSESMVGSGALLLLADDHFSRRQAMFEIGDREAWIRELVVELEASPATQGTFGELDETLEQLVDNLRALDTLVQQRIDTQAQRVSRGLHDADGILRLHHLEERIAEQVRINRTLSMELGVAVGFHVNHIRSQLDTSVERLNEEIRRRERVLAAFAGVAMLVLLVTVLYVNRSVVRRVLQLHRAISRQRPAPEELDVSGRDEIARMARSMQRYMHDISDNERRILAMNRELDFLASHDALTHLYNRHHFERALDARQAELQENLYSVVMVDIDHFKRINDTHGHAAGDQVICRVAELLDEGLPEAALLARYGGEEFVALVPGYSAAALEPLLEATRRRLARSAIVVDGVSLRVTASFGVAQKIPAAAFSLCLKAADEALYEAKRRGRNRVVVRPLRQSDSEGGGDG